MILREGRHLTCLEGRMTAHIGYFRHTRRHLLHGHLSSAVDQQSQAVLVCEQRCIGWVKDLLRSSSMVACLRSRRAETETKALSYSFPLLEMGRDENSGLPGPFVPPKPGSRQ